MLKVGRRFSVMHTIKGGWAGQTFAQAKRNESGGGRRPRRLSKEKRKEMVESFIKKYQDSNNGNFPSLNLTHKEVGGSFYTIREIVRDVIQENRVLGPAKSLPEEQDTDQSFKHFPLGTISLEPEASLPTSEDGSSIGSYRYEETNEELFFISDKVYAQPGQSHIVNGSNIALSNKEYHDIDVANDQVGELLETKKHMEEAPLSSSKVTEMADVIVETFPLPPITQPTDNLDENFGAVKDLKEPLVEKDVEKPIGLENDMLSDGIMLPSKSSLVDDIEIVTMAGERESGSVDRKAVKATTDVPLGSSNSLATESDVVNHTQVDIDVEVMSSPYDKANAETKVVNASNVTETKGINGSYASAKITEPTSKEEVIVENKANVHDSSSSEKKSNPTLDRINLESWEVETKAPKKSATNPVVAALKSFIDAFAKFWS